MSTNVKSLSAILGSPPQSASAIVSARGAGEEPPEYEPFAHGRLANRPQLMVVFRKASGEVCAFSYVSLTEIRSPNPEKGFTVDFSGVKVAVQGEGLGRLFRYLCDHKAAEIVEADREALFQGDANASIVTTVMVSR